MPASISYVPNPLNPGQRATAASANTGDACLYDAAGQLTGVLQDATNVQGGDAGNGNSFANYPGAAGPRHRYTWSYDAAGNWSQAGFDGGTVTYQADALNRYTSYGGPISGTFGYDTYGNTTAQLRWTYLYDAEGKLLNATNRPAGTPPSPAPSRYTNIQFTYDALGRCVRRVTQSLAPGSYAVTASVTANLTYDGWSLIEERDENQALRYRYVHGAGGELVCRFDAAGNPLYYHYDALGSVTHLTNAAGAVVESYRYSAYGVPEVFDARGNQLLTAEAYPNYVSYSAVGNRFLFRGYEYLEAPVLYDCRARLYSAQTGRFLQPDPGGFGASGANLYAYCANDPVNFSDPSGLDPDRVIITATNPGNPTPLVLDPGISGGSAGSAGADEPQGYYDIDGNFHDTRKGDPNRVLAPFPSNPFIYDPVKNAPGIKLSYAPPLPGDFGPAGDNRTLSDVDRVFYDFRRDQPLGSAVMAYRGGAIAVANGSVAGGAGLVAGPVGYAAGFLSAFDPPPPPGVMMGVAPGQLIRGVASEARVLGSLGLAKNTAAVATIEGRAIPDALTRTLSIEVKDTAAVSLTRQLRIQTGAASAAGRQSVLITGNNTNVSAPAQRAFGQIIRRPDLGP